MTAENNKTNFYRVELYNVKVRDEKGIGKRRVWEREGGGKGEVRDRYGRGTGCLRDYKGF